MHLIGLAFASAAGGLLLQWIGLSGGVIIGAMLGSAIYTLVKGGEAITIPGPLQTAALIVLGAALGAGVTRGMFTTLAGYLLPAALAGALIILAGVGITYLLRSLGIAPPGDVLATSPGALSAVTGVAVDRGEGAAEVGLFHTVRVLLVLLTLPLLTWLLPSHHG